LTARRPESSTGCSSVALFSDATTAADRRRTAIAVTDNVTQYVHQLEAGPAGCLVAALEKTTPDQRRLITKGVKTLRTLLDGSN